MNEITLVLIVFVFSFLGNYLSLKNFKFIFRKEINQKTQQEEYVLQKVGSQGKAEFVPDATEEEIQEMYKDPKLKQFLKSIMGAKK